MKKIISTNNAPKAIGPYSQAVLAGNTLYCSGQIGINPKNGLLNTTNITTETNQVMQN
ncbi:MAG: RidA family protein, partial [Aureispira sp.]|nr:RidA family protein [Aureispira sp.]